METINIGDIYGLLSLWLNVMFLSGFKRIDAIGLVKLARV